MNILSLILFLCIILPPLLVAVLSRTAATQFNRTLSIFTLLASFISLVFSVILVILLVHRSQSSSYFQYFFFLNFHIYIDALSSYFILLVNIVALFASWATIYMTEREYRSGVYEENDAGSNAAKRFHYYFNLFHCSMLLVPMVDNLILLWAFMVVTTIFSAPLIGYRQDQRAQEAAWKYIMISSTGIVVALLGTFILVKACSGIPNLNMNWSELSNKLMNSKNIIGKDQRTIFELSFLLILLGYGTKAGLFPMHSWLPDGHGEAPAPVSALLSGVLLKSALYVILRFYIITNLALQNARVPQPSAFASNSLLIAGLISLFMATPFILNTRKRNRFKRVLAYHSLEHMGIITFGFGLGIDLAFLGALLHTLNHAFSKSLMFLAYGNIQAAYIEEKVPEEKMRGVFQSMPVTGGLLALGGLALVGAPLFSIFFSEFIILWAAIQRMAAGATLIILPICLFILSVTLIFCGLVVHLGRILLGKSLLPQEVVRESWKRLLPLAVLLLLLVIGGLTALPLQKLLVQSVHILCEGVIIKGGCS